MYLLPSAHLNLDNKLAGGIPGLYLEFMKITVEKVHSHPQTVPRTFRSFPGTE